MAFLQDNLTEIERFILDIFFICFLIQFNYTTLNIVGNWLVKGFVLNKIIS